MYPLANVGGVGAEATGGFVLEVLGAAALEETPTFTFGDTDGLGTPNVTAFDEGGGFVLGGGPETVGGPESDAACAANTPSAPTAQTTKLESKRRAIDEQHEDACSPDVMPKGFAAVKTFILSPP
jgi:hypothetical protein